MGGERIGDIISFLYLSLVIIKYKLLHLNEHVFNGCTCTCR